jgi:hypothetical protein
MFKNWMPSFGHLIRQTQTVGTLYTKRPTDDLGRSARLVGKLIRGIFRRQRVSDSTQAGQPLKVRLKHHADP